MQIWRYLFLAVAVLFVVGVVVQVFLAGVGLFGAGDMAGHVDFGYLLSVVPLLPLLLAWPARAGRRTVTLCAALLVATQVQTFLPLLRDDAPLVAALHPVNALLVFGLGLMVARRGLALARMAGETQTSVSPAPLTPSGRPTATPD
ncbi:MAG: hypothetical protein H0W17_07680 [Chloroflexi bacterium]|nr:hypothetical protein [Chloroflexota bacterium]